jgi:hypothetical protein
MYRSLKTNVTTLITWYVLNKIYVAYKSWTNGWFLNVTASLYLKNIVILLYILNLFFFKKTDTDKISPLIFNFLTFLNCCVFCNFY